MSRTAMIRFKLLSIIVDIFVFCRNDTVERITSCLKYDLRNAIYNSLSLLQVLLESTFKFLVWSPFKCFYMSGSHVLC